MPRRHQIGNPAPRPTHPVQASHGSAASSSINPSIVPSKQATAPLTQVRNTSSASSSSSSTKQRASPSTSSTTRSTAPKVSPSCPSRSNSNVSAGSIYCHATPAEIQSIVDAVMAASEGTLNADTMAAVALSKSRRDGHCQGETDAVCGPAEMRKLIVRQVKGQEEHLDRLMNQTISRSINQSNNRSNNRSNNQSRNSKSNSKDQKDLISVMLISEHTTLQPSQSNKWLYTFGEREMVTTNYALLCLPDRQAEWEMYLDEMNQQIAAALPCNPVTDSSGQKATHVILSNCERKMNITLKFRHPCSSPNEKWASETEFALLMLSALARYQQLSKHPESEDYHKKFEELMETMSKHLKF